jgi:small neutral amino acid transporter SnatA (MarC family)
VPWTRPAPPATRTPGGGGRWHVVAVVWRTFGQSFVTLLVILDPLGGVPAFLGLTRALDSPARHRAAYSGVLAASGMLAVFAAFGQAILAYLSISVESLMVAGGMLLFVVAPEML